jgi:hypothetical protein
MSKKIRYLLIALPLVLLAAACASLKLPGSTTSSSTNGNMPAQTLEDKLAVGTLKLEGTSNAITADQAKTLLPLWKAAKSLSSSSTASTDEITALYKQIEEAMTADQVKAIQDLSLTPNDTQALMQQYGIQGGPGGSPQGTPDATRAASRSSGSQSGGAQAGGAQGGGPGGGAGGPPAGGDFGGGAPPDGAGFPGGAQTTGTPAAGQASRQMRGGMNFMFFDTVIKLLQTKAGN